MVAWFMCMLTGLFILIITLVVSFMVALGACVSREYKDTLIFSVITVLSFYGVVALVISIVNKASGV